MKRILTLAAVFALAPLIFATQNQTREPLRLILDLQDGSRLIGIPSIGSLRIRTSFADMDVPLTKIGSLRLTGDRETVSVESANGDRITGTWGLESLELQTVFGTVTIQGEHIVALRVLPGGETRTWTFEGNDANMFTKEGTGALAEKDGKIAASNYGSGNDWHGPKATLPISLPGDFRLAGNVNYRIGQHQIGRIRLGVTLESGATLLFGIGSSHVGTVDHDKYFHVNDEVVWSKGRTMSAESFSDLPVAFERRGAVLTCFVNDKLVGSRTGCDPSPVRNVFFSFERFQSYSPLSEASLGQLTVRKIERGP